MAYGATTPAGGASSAVGDLFYYSSRNGDPNVET